ncbi:MAG: MerR family DNA-binding transcriptional regulator [Thomasclavelia ramosa]
MTIAEVSKKFGISSTTLRYYEKLIMNPVAKILVVIEIIRNRICVESILLNVCGLLE